MSPRQRPHPEPGRRKARPASLLETNSEPQVGEDTFVGLLDTDVTPGSGVDGYVVYYQHSSGKFKLQAATTPGAHTLESHSDVTLTSPVSGEFLKRGASDWENAALECADLSDLTATAAELNLLDLSGLTAGWVLKATGAATAAWGQLALSQLSGVAYGSPNSGDVFAYNGSNYAPTALGINNLSDVTITSASSGQVISHDGAGWVNTSISSTFSGTMVKNPDGGAAANPITWTGEVHDSASAFDIGSPTIITVPAGKNYFRARAFLAWTSGGVQTADVKLEGTAVAAEDGGGQFVTDCEGAGSTTLNLVTGLIACTAGDEISLKTSSIPSGDSWLEVEFFAL